MVKWLDKFYKLSQYNTTVRKEFIAALTTFLAMSYVIFVNPSILAQAGIPKLPLITSTILVSIIGTLLVAFIPRLPLAIAPGMGLNAFFVYSLVIGQNIPWQQGLAIVFVSGIILLILAFFRFQKKIMMFFPEPIKVGAMVGIGLFLTLVGFNNLGIIEPSPVTFIQLKTMSSVNVLALITFLLTIILLIKNVPGAVVIGIIFCTIISITLGFSSTPESIFSMPPSISEIFMQMDIVGILSISFIAPIFTLIFVDLFDSLATFSASVESLDFMTKEEKEKALDKTFKVDAFNGALSGVFGNSTTIVYLESISGIMQGGKTGLTALFVALFFILALFLSPLISVVPAYASASALIIIGIKMAEMIKQIDFSSFRYSVPAYITALMMPFTYNISYGIIFGFISYLAIEVACGNIKKIHWINWVIGVICVINLMGQQH